MNNERIELFKKMAEDASAILYIADTENTVVEYIEKIMKLNGYSRFAAPGMPAALCRNLETGGFEKIGSPLRDRAGEIDAGIVNASFGIAETGTLVVNSDNEDIRLATMLSETNFILLNPENIVEKSSDISNELNTWFKKNNYTAFITGPSRTADIERVLTLGAHGPEHLHIILTNNK
ncbi:MAG: lactate utilization protein [Bacteroidales bacterium]|nr:lactate utilization protein [Bacteroidales bacterium]